MVGPLAASATIFALIRPALRAVIWFSSAAGIRTSQSSSSSSLFGDPVSGQPVTFVVQNVNTSGVPCATDSKTYTVSGHLTGPASHMASTTLQDEPAGSGA